jgi:cysteinyl-tRNA synthetase
VTIDQEKMSKSLGNFFTIREIFEQSPYSEIITGECLRYYLLSTHYRSDINFSDQSIAEAKAALDNVYGLMQRLEESEIQGSTLRDIDLELKMKKFVKKFHGSMDDDFNTPKALAAFQTMRGEVNKMLVKGLSGQAKQKAKEELKKLGEPLGLFQLTPKDWPFNAYGSATISGGGSVKVEGKKTAYGSATISGGSSVETSPLVSSEWIEEKICRRKEARENKDFSAADQIRKALAEKGIILEDRPDGTTRWKR